LHHLIVIASNFVKEPVVRLPHMGRYGISLSSCQQTGESFGHFAHFMKGDFTIKQLINNAMPCTCSNARNRGGG
jgi:hypothetical protein